MDRAFGSSLRSLALSLSVSSIYGWNIVFTDGIFYLIRPRSVALTLKSRTWDSYWIPPPLGFQIELLIGTGQQKRVVLGVNGVFGASLAARLFSSVFWIPDSKLKNQSWRHAASECSFNLCSWGMPEIPESLLLVIRSWWGEISEADDKLFRVLFLFFRWTYFSFVVVEP